MKNRLYDFSGGEKCLLQAKNDPQVPESIQSLMSHRYVHLNFTKSYGRVAYLEFDLAHPHDAPALLDAYVHFFITTTLPLPWATQAPFSSRPNGASDKYSFLVSAFS